MKNEFTLAFNEVLEEKQLPKEIILKALESAMVSAYRRAVNASRERKPACFLADMCVVYCCLVPSAARRRGRAGAAPLGSSPGVAHFPKSK